MESVLKVILGTVLVAGVLVGGFFAIRGGAGEDVLQTLQTQQIANSITDQQFASIELGSSRKTIEETLGEPVGAREVRDARIRKREPRHSSCIYYNKRGGSFGEVFQLCFREGKLKRKKKF